MNGASGEILTMFRYTSHFGVDFSSSSFRPCVRRRASASAGGRGQGDSKAGQPTVLLLQRAQRGSNLAHHAQLQSW